MIIYEGPSQINAMPIVAIATFDSVNTKTGKMDQIWILSQEGDPLQVAKSLRDQSICGSCPHRYPNRTCYVQLSWATRNIYRKYMDGGYERFDTVEEMSIAFKGSNVRLRGLWGPCRGPYPILGSDTERSQRLDRIHAPMAVCGDTGLPRIPHGLHRQRTANPPSTVPWLADVSNSDRRRAAASK